MQDEPMQALYSEDMEYRQDPPYRDEPRDHGYGNRPPPFAEGPLKGGYLVDHGPRADDRLRPDTGRPDDRKYSSQRDAPPRDRDSSYRYRNEEEIVGPSRHLWVGSVTSDISDEMLIERFSKFGEVESASVYGVRNYAFVNFRNVEDAADAMRSLRGTSFKGGLPLRIEFAKGARPSRHLWVGGISPDISRQHLESEFQRYGRLEDFRYVRERNCAHVDFAQQEDAVAAVEGLNGKVVGGEPLRVEYGRTPYRGPTKDSRSSAYEERDRPSRDHGIPSSPDSGRRREADSHRDSRAPPENHRGHYAAGDSHQGQVQGSGGAAKEGEPSEVLWVGFPLWVKVDDEILNREFCPYGEIARIKTFSGRTYAFVQFVRKEDAARAKEELEGKLFNEPRVHIKFSKTLGPGPGAEPGRDEGQYRDGPPLPRPGYGEARYGGGPPGSYRPVTPPERVASRRDGDPPPRNSGSNRVLLPRRAPDGRPLDELEYYDGARAGLRPPPGAGLLPLRGGVRPVYDDWGEAMSHDDESMGGPREAKRARYGPGYDAQYEDGLPYVPDAGRVYESVLERSGPPLAPLPPRPVPGPGRPPPQELGLVRPPPGALAPAPASGAGGGAGPVPEGAILARLPSQVAPGVSGGAQFGAVPERAPPETAPAPWVGSLAKGGTLICRARAYPVGKGIDCAIPEVINCTARTDLDVLAKHIYMAKDFGVVALVPAENADIPPYEDFVQYLGEKRRAGVAKLLDGSTLFLVPPSDFSQQVLKIPRKDALFGVALNTGQPQGVAQAGPPPSIQQAPPLAQPQLLPPSQGPASHMPPVQIAPAQMHPGQTPPLQAGGAPPQDGHGQGPHYFQAQTPQAQPTQQAAPQSASAPSGHPAGLGVPPTSQSLPQGLTAEVLASLTALLPQSGGQQMRPSGPPAGGTPPVNQLSQGPPMQPPQGQPPSRPDVRPSLAPGPGPPIPLRPQGPGQYGAQQQPMWQQQAPQQDVQPTPAGQPPYQMPFQQQQQQPPPPQQQQPPPQQQQPQQQYMQPPQQPQHAQQAPQLAPGGVPMQSGPTSMQPLPSAAGGPFQQQPPSGSYQSGQPGPYSQPGQAPSRPPATPASPQLPADQLAQLTAMLSQRQLPPVQKQPPQQPQPAQPPSSVAFQPTQQYQSQGPPAQQHQFQQQPPPQQQQQPPPQQGMPQQWPPLPTQPMPHSFPPQQQQQHHHQPQQQQQHQLPQQSYAPQQQQAYAPQPLQQQMSAPQSQGMPPQSQSHGMVAQWEPTGPVPQPAATQQHQTSQQPQAPPQQQQTTQQPPHPADMGTQSQPQGDAEAKRFQATLQLAAALLQQMQQQQQQNKTS